MAAEMNELEAGAGVVAASGGTNGMKAAAGYLSAGKLAAITATAAGIASAFVMASVAPTTKREMFYVLATTFCFAIFGGSIAIKYLGLHAWAQSGDFFGIMGLMGVCVVCGLPGWMLIKLPIEWQKKNPDKTMLDFIKDLVTIWRG